MKSQVLHTQLCEVLFLVRLQAKFALAHSWDWKRLTELEDLYCLQVLDESWWGQQGYFTSTVSQP